MANNKGYFDGTALFFGFLFILFHVVGGFLVYLPFLFESQHVYTLAIASLYIITWLALFKRSFITKTKTVPIIGIIFWSLFLLVAIGFFQTGTPENVRIVLSKCVFLLLPVASLLVRNAYLGASGSLVLAISVGLTMITLSIMLLIHSQKKCDC